MTRSRDSAGGVTRAATASSTGATFSSLLPTKGNAGPLSARLQVVYPDSARKDRKVARTGTVPLGLFNANQFKDDLAGQLGRAMPGTGTCISRRRCAPRRSRMSSSSSSSPRSAMPRSLVEAAPGDPQRGGRPDGDLHAIAHLHGLGGSTGPSRRRGRRPGTRIRWFRPDRGGAWRAGGDAAALRSGRSFKKRSILSRLA